MVEPVSIAFFSQGDHGPQAIINARMGVLGMGVALLWYRGSIATVAKNARAGIS